ncbi:MAG: hypothetical protein ABR521_01505 [Gaiellaceae bacterium]
MLAAVLAVACVLYVAAPFLREPAPEDDFLDQPGRLGRRSLALEEERDRALAALKELEFDHRTGKVSDEDYGQLVGPLRRQAAEALRALEPRASGAATARSVPFRAMVELPDQPGAPGAPPAEPTPVPHEPPQQPTIPEPYPPPATPPAPAPVPEPTPVPHEPPQVPQTIPGGPQGT